MEALEQALQAEKFVPATPTQELSVGWVPPRGNATDAMAEVINNQVILKMFVERKSVPASAVAEEVERKCKELETQRGYAPGRREKRELKDEAKLTLLARAFSKLSACLVWLDRDAGTLVINSTSSKMCDTVIDRLLIALEKLSFTVVVAPVTTALSPVTAMANWLIAKEAPEHFQIERDCELKQADSDKATVKYGRHNLDIDEIAVHIEQGKRPTRLALAWEDRISFVLHEDMTFRSIAVLDSVFDASKSEDGGFDADVTLETAELQKFIPDMIEALGGAAVPEEGATPKEEVEAE